MLSLWSDTFQAPSFMPLQGNIKTDVLIIGGGMAGLLCAYMLKQAGTDYVLVEAEKICDGVTKNTTAKISSQHGLIYDKLIRQFGTEKARLYLRANQQALDEYRKLCQNIDCDFEDKNNFVYSLNDRIKLEKEIDALEKLGFEAELKEDIPLPLNIAGAVEFKNQAQFHPLKFVSNISEGLNIYEHTKVRELEETTAITDRGRVEAKNIIVATHFPFINKHGSYFIKMYQSRSYVLALENAANVQGMYLDSEDNGLSFRNSGNYLLLGGGGHRTGKKGVAWKELESFADRYYPKAQKKYRWATQDCMTLDAVPYIGRYSAQTEGLYVATGFNKWGMTSSMAAATLLTDMIHGKENEYEQVFSPSRSILYPQLAINGFEAVTSLLTPSNKRCPHLGCALKWNEHEHSWDCPCHGSRFTKDGRLIDNPATGDLKSEN